MNKRQILWAMVFGAMLAVTGCGDDGGDGGGGGSSGTGGGSANSTCEAICSSQCVLQGVDPDNTDCLAQCEQGVPQFDDDCGSQAESYLNCIESVDCNPDSNDCQSQAIAWGTCIAGAF